MAYISKSADTCIAENDFFSALENLLHTTPRWIEHWFKCCCIIFDANPHLTHQFIKDTTNRVFRPHSTTDLISIWYYNGKEIFTNGIIDLLDRATQKCYLFRFYNADGHLVCSKVGTTTKAILIRIKRELNDYADLGIVSCVIDRVYDCGDIPAEGMESYFRAEYIRRHPTHFRKNDRFFSVAFDLDEADRICHQYLN